MNAVTMVTGSISRNGGGVSEVVRLLSTELVRQGVEVNVLSLEDEHSAVDAALWGDIQTRCFRRYGPARFGFSPGLLQALLSSRTKVVHAHGLWQFQGLCVSLWSKLRAGRYVLTPHGMLDPWITSRSRKLKWLVSKLFQDRLIKGAASIHVLTVREEADTRALFPSARTDLIPNFTRGAETDCAPPWQTPDLAGRNIYLFLGRIHEKKGWRELCAAWDSLCSADDDFKKRSALVFCGWLDGSPDFDPTVQALNARHGNAIFAGPQYGEQKVASLQAADIFILPSKSEGLPMVVLEAWAQGVPVLMTQDCNLPIGFERGAAIKIGQSPEGISAGLKQADSWTKADHAKVSAAARRLIAEEFSPVSVTEKFRALYNRIANL